MREHYKPVQRLDRPSALDKTRRQIIEQFRMGRSLTPRSKIVGSLNDSLSKVMLPDAIDHHSGCQGILGIGQPRRQFQPAASFFSFRQSLPAKDLEETARRFVTFVVGISFSEDPGVAGLPIRNGVGLLYRRRLVFQLCYPQFYF